MPKQKQFSKEFKTNAAKYVAEYPDLTQEQCARNPGISITTLTRWLKRCRDAGGVISYRGLR